MNYILSIDQGTTGSTALLINADNYELIDKKNTEFPQIMPKPGIVEHNLEDIFNSVQTSCEQVLTSNNVQPNQIIAVGITNQRETTCAFNQKGEQIENAIVWQDRRTHPFCEELKSKGLESKIKEKTGLTIDPYFSGTKIKWFIDNSENVKKALENNDCKFGTIDTYLLYKLTGGESFKTETSNASRTLLMNLSTAQWDDELLDVFCVPKNTLPEICDSFGEFGATKGLSFLPDGIPITGILGDQQAALFGQGGVNPGDIKCTYGTGAFALISTGNELKYSNFGLLSTSAFSHQGKQHYALEGSSYIAGAAVQWLRDNLKIISSAPEIEEHANKVLDNENIKNICFFPYFTGLGSPYWNSEALASIVGLSRDSAVPEICRAVLEGISLTIDDLVNAMKEDYGKEINSLRVDGGAVANNLLMSLQASFSNLRIERPAVIETTGHGAALAAAVGLNKLSIDDVKSFSKIEKTFEPDTDSYFTNKKSLWKNHQRVNYLN